MIDHSSNHLPIIFLEVPALFQILSCRAFLDCSVEQTILGQRPHRTGFKKESFFRVLCENA